MSELLPNKAPLANEVWRAPGAIPPAFRAFGKFPRTKEWWPGDLILSRETNPDRVSNAIAQAQIRGGYDAADAEWTHAAVYLGDGLNVCEATFDSLWSGGSVRVTPLWDYCGSHSIRVRRSNYIANAGRDMGWLMALYAMTHLRKDYDFGFVLNLARTALSGRGFWQSGATVSIRPTALVCSTLYADAHNRVTRQMFGETNGLCVPAYLSQSTDMTNIDTDWLNIARRGTAPAPQATLAPSIVVGVVQRGREVILVRRNKADQGLLWQFPAGTVSPKRTHAESAVHDVEEETGINCTVVRELGNRQHPNTGTTLVYFHCQYESGELTNGDPQENAEVKWVRARDVAGVMTSDMYAEVTKLLSAIDG